MAKLVVVSVIHTKCKCAANLEPHSCMKFVTKLSINLKIAVSSKNLGGADNFYPIEFTPDGVLSSLYSSVRTHVQIFVEIFGFFWIVTLVVLDDFFI